MKSSRMLLIAAVLLVGVVSFFNRGSAQDAPARPTVRATRVAVCNVVAVFNKCRRAKDLDKELEQKGKAVTAEDKKRLNAIKQLEETLKSLEPGSKIYDQKSTQLQELALKQAVWRRVQEQTMMRWRHRHTEEMYREILTTVETVAKKQGYDLVIHRENIPIASKTTTELLKKMGQRKCLYHNPAIDVTDVVLNLMNSQYANRPK